MIDLHLVSWNRPKMTELVIQTIHKNTPRDQFHLSVLDNGSKTETTDMLQRLYDDGQIDVLVNLKENYGLEYARQYLLEHQTHGEYFVCIDNDCLPPANWLAQMVDLMENYENYAAISQRTQVMIGTGNIFEEADELGEDLVDFPHPGGSFRIMRTDAVIKVGGWDRKAPGRGSEERYICGKLRQAGYKTGFAAKIQCLHLFGDRAQTQERWGYEDGMAPEETGHSDIWHPALANGDDVDEMRKYAGGDDVDRYYQTH